MGWKPGQSGNPKGRTPIAPTLTGLLREQVDPQTFVTRLLGLTDPAICPDPRTRLAAHQLILSYVDGPPVQQIKQTLEEVRRPQVVITLPDNGRARPELPPPADEEPRDVGDDPNQSPDGPTD